MEGELPYWLVNVPKDQQPTECPDFLINANAKDRAILSTPDEMYRRQNWDDVKAIISANRIDLFQRLPSDLRRYLAYNWQLKRQYGSVMQFVLQERLRWQDPRPRGHVPFDDPADIKILFNDWPYGLDEKIVHLVVWTKFDLEDDPATDDLTPGARKAIDAFVNATFCSRVTPDHVVWFKNWRSLKSIHAVEHFHVMLYNPDKAFLAEVTDNDVAISDRVKQ